MEILSCNGNQNNINKQVFFFWLGNKSSKFNICCVVYTCRQIKILEV